MAGVLEAALELTCGALLLETPVLDTELASWLLLDCGSVATHPANKRQAKPCPINFCTAKTRLAEESTEQCHISGMTLLPKK